MVTFLSSWERQRVDWLDQMQLIGAEMPGTERLYLDRWRFDAGSGTSYSTTEATGFARQREEAQQFAQRLADQAGIRVRPNPIGSGGNDPDYPILVQLNAELAPPNRQPVKNKRE
jgi:hypothetical protein